ncbi:MULTISPECIES: hypothetical protein [unclassified Streptomyces]|uniref:hypothetical protein n=1 Tax=unclassified Streptomyces TaxID=2593676 RepID=UPI002E11E876|nr:hypothetical protein OG452_01080 [Streptomyces sp. NBC_01197]WSS53214.1 hypothetical protein OG708_33980 [Streptomyces sp. NBC_01180]
MAARAARGRGGMGVVWRAWDERLERQVAVQFARPDDDRTRQQLKKEARNAGRLHHANMRRASAGVRAW